MLINTPKNCARLKEKHSSIVVFHSEVTGSIPATSIRKEPIISVSLEILGNLSEQLLRKPFEDASQRLSGTGYLCFQSKKRCREILYYNLSDRN